MHLRKQLPARARRPAFSLILVLALVLITLNLSAAPVQAGAGPLWINEVVINPPGTDAPNEYVEIRGTANATIPSGTYFVAIEGDSGPGSVDQVFNLGGMTLGTNGYLILRQSGNSYAVNPSATSVTSTGASWIAPWSTGNTADMENGTNTFLLINAPSAPTTSVDIDSDNNGTPDGATYSGWTIHDSIGVTDGGASDCSYAAIVFRTSGGLFPGGTTVVTTTFQPAYMGRPTGDPSGDTASDWVAGVIAGTAPNFTLSSALPAGYLNDALDHLGGPNFPAAAGTPPVIAGLPAGRSGVANAPTVTQQDFSGANGLTFTVTDSDGVQSVTASNGNPSVLTSVTVTALGGSSYRLELGAPATTNGYSLITVTATDTLNTSATATFRYAANADDAGTTEDRYPTGLADASTGVPVDASYMFVANDEDQGIRLYQRNFSALPLNSFDFTANLGLTDLNGGVPREVDFEASTRAGNRLYFMGSHSNSSAGAARPNRYRIMGVDVSGSGTGATLSYVGRYDNLRTDLLAWDSGNVHGLGANFFGLTASAATGVVPETVGGFNIEGLSFAPGSTTTAYVAFRAPIVPASGRTNALIVPVTNFNTLVTANPSTGPATFGAPIQLNLGGRGIRSIECSADGCLIVAGSADGAGNFQLYAWSGVAGETPIPVNAVLTSMNPEGLVSTPTGAIGTWNSQFIELISDMGDTIWYNDGIIAKDLTIPEIRKYRTDRVQLGVTVAPGTNRIRNIQGAVHISPLNGQAVVNVPGIVTAKRSNGFFMQDPDATGDDGVASSEGIFVFISGSTNPLLTARYVGEPILVSGTVTEFRPGGGVNLTVTEIVNNAAVRTLSISPWVDCPAPCTITPTVIGQGGRIIPTETISNPEGNVELSLASAFNPAVEGMDFFESLEGMLVRVNNAVVVGPTNDFSEVRIVADNGAGTTGRNARSSITISQTDFNPERIQLDDGITGGPFLPQMNVGSTIPTVVGVIDYNFSNYEITVRDEIDPVFNTPPLEVTNLISTTVDQLTIATFNVENMGGDEWSFLVERRAQRIVENLNSPDILLLQEVQDNDGPTNSGTVAADVSLNNLITAIAGAGGPADYLYVQIDPENNQDGGEPGGNIRVAILYRSSRVTFTGLGTATATTANDVVCTNGQPSLTLNPGRIDPTNAAFSNSRKPLAAQFQFGSDTIIIVNNHFNSKGGDQPLYGSQQPPILTSEAQRMAQATVVRDFLKKIFVCNNTASVIVAGDLNDFQFSNPVLTLEGSHTPMTIMNLLLPAEERYSYNYEGNAQALDQILVSENLLKQWGPEFDTVHINSEYYPFDGESDSPQVSDHDPSIIRITRGAGATIIPGPTPPPSAGGTPTSPLTLPATGYAPAEADPTPALLIGGILCVLLSMLVGRFLGRRPKS